jgi:predicted amidohydrolase YtcJ
VWILRSGISGAFQSVRLAIKMTRTGGLEAKTMRVAILRKFLVACTFGLLVSAAFSQQPAPDLILLNGKVFTSSTSHPYVDALAIRGERIVAAGTSKEIAALAGKDTKRIDLRSRVVIPGINDAHYHLGVAPETYDLPIQGNDPKWQQIKEALSSAVGTVPKGTWIDAVFGASILDDPQATRTALDLLAPDNPVVLLDWTGHASLLNTSALRKLGISENEPNPEGGMYVRNQADSKLTGMVLEFAQFRAGRRLSELASQEQAEQQLREFFDQAARWGVTTVQNMSNPIAAERCVLLFEKAPPPVRVRVIWFGLTDEHGRLTKQGRDVPAHPIPLVTVSGTKWILDGTPIERSAAMRKPYADRPGASGELNFSQKEMEDMLRESLQRDDQLLVHVVGDRTVETFLNAMDATGGKEVWGKRRVRMEHGDGILPDLVLRVRELGVIVVQNPTHLALRDLMVRRYGNDRADQLLPLRSLLQAGIPLALGSDGPANPFLNIMLATTYPGKPQEAITREQTVTAYTLTSAYAEFSEKDKGSLEPGKLADLAVLSQDIFEVSAGDLPKTESVLTMVGGKIVYDAKVLTVH